MTSEPKRRWLAYSLWTLFVVVQIGIVCSLGWTIHQINDRDRLLDSLRMRGALMGKLVSEEQAKTIPLLWGMLGARPVGVIVLPDDAFTNDELAEIVSLFPETTIQQCTFRMDDTTMGRNSLR